jgi:peptidoglycan/xylan/chitin deacetylase (PgdA/CDA1 family)
MIRKMACITLDMERDYGDPEGRVRLLDQPDFFERYIRIVNKYQAKVTMFTVTSLFEEFGKDFENLATRIPLEFSVHSHSHDPSTASNRNEIENAQKVFKRYTGKTILGYRAPMGQITQEGFGHLMELGFTYDSSVYTSYRPGKFGYSNLNKPNTPFWVTNGRERMVEIPFTSISTVRIPFALSYAKLVGWTGYSALLNLFSLPNITTFLSHPYDFYFHMAGQTVKGLEKMALSRNATKAFEYFENILATLASRGYKFVFISELFEYIKDSNLEEVKLTKWK